MTSIYYCAVAPLVRFRLQTMPHLFGSAKLHHQSVKSWQSELFFLGGGGCLTLHKKHPRVICSWVDRGLICYSV